jgi:CBS domain-containing protein
MRLTDIMSSPVETIAPGTSVTLARTAMKRRGTHHLVVVRGSKVVGILSARDLRGVGGDDPIDEVMSTDVVTAPASAHVRDAANLLRGRQVGCLPIVERGRAVGMVTISDLLELLGRGVERPVGKSTRWTLKARGPRKTRPSADRSHLDHVP